MICYLVYFIASSPRYLGFYPQTFQHTVENGLIRALLHGKAACVCSPYNRPNPQTHLTFVKSVSDLRTIIVIADIHRGLHSPACSIATTYPPWLTFRHWSGVTPYTSSYEFAGSCVFGKQLPGKLSLRPPAREGEGQALSLTYGRFFA